MTDKNQKKSRLLLYLFIESSEVMTGSDLYCSLRSFKDRFVSFCQARGFRTRFDRDLYNNIFYNTNLEVKEMLVEYPLGSGNTFRMPFLLRADFTALGPLIENVPVDIVAHYLSFLNLEDMIKAGRSCKALNEASKSPIAWSGKYILPRVDDAGLARFIQDRPLVRGMNGCLDITDAGLRHIGELKYLTHLDIVGDTITDAGIAHLSSLQLVSLSVSWGGKMTDACVEHLRDMPLTSLELMNSANITTVAVATITLFFPSLTHLDLSGCDIGNGELEHIGKLTDLKSLDLGNTTLEGEGGLAHLSDLVSLTRLDINDNDISDRALVSLVECESLTHLDVSECSLITDAGFSMVAYMAVLTSLHASCFNVTDQGLDWISRSPSRNRLAKLVLDGCHEITNVGLMHLGRLNHLKHFEIQDCPLITDVGLELMSHLSLETVVIRPCCSQITDAGRALLF
jgi:hypothetical protein